MRRGSGEWTTGYARAFLVLVVVLLGAARASATDHSGTCTGTWTAAGNPHVIVSSCSVPTGQTLTIQSGVVVQAPVANSYAQFSVAGSVDATSATFDRIYFQTSTGSSVSIQSSTVTQSTYYGFWIDGGTVSIQNSTLVAAGGNPFLYYRGASTGTISGNTISAPGSATAVRVRVWDSASPTITGNDFVDNTSQVQTCVELAPTGASTASVTSNTFRLSGADVPIQFSNAAAAAPLTVSGNTFPAGPGAGLQVTGSIATPATLSNVNGLPVTLAGLTLASGAALTIAPAAQISLGSLSVGAGATLTLSASSQLVGPPSSFGTLGTSGTVNVTSATLDRVYLAVSGGAVSIQSSTVTQSTYYGFWIDGGTVSIQNSTLVAAGGNPFLYYRGASTGTISGNTISAPGSATAVRVRVWDSASPMITGNDFVDNASQVQTCVDLSPTGPSTASVTNNVFRLSGGDVAIILGNAGLAAAVTISGNTYPTGVGAGLQITGAIASSATLSNLDGLVANVSGFTVASGGTLTVPAGVQNVVSGMTVAAGGSLVLASGAQLHAPASTYGTLAVNGTLTATSVTLDRLYVSVGSGGSASIQGSTILQSSYWGFYVASGNLDVQSCTIVASGGNPLFELVGASTGTISGNTITWPGTSVGTILRAGGSSSPQITGNDFGDNTGESQTYIQLDVDVTSTARLTGNTIRVSGADVPLRLGVAAIAAPLTISGNTFPTGTAQGAQISGTIATPATLVNPDGLVVTVNTMNLNAGATLTIPASTQITSLTGIVVGAGSSLALPTGVALRIDSLTVGSGASVTVPAGLIMTAGSWSVAAGGTLTLPTGSELHGPTGTYGHLSVAGTLSATSATLDRLYVSTSATAAVSIQSSTIQQSSYWGFYLQGGNVDVQNCNIVGNGGNPLFDYRNGATGTISGNTISWPGSISGVRIWVEAGAAPLITANDFVDNTGQSQTYVQLDVDITSTASVTNNVFRVSGGDVPLKLGAAAITAPITIAGNTFPTGNAAGAQVSGTIAAPTTLTNPNGLAVTVTALTLASGAVLTIPASTQLTGIGSLTVNGGATVSLPATGALSLGTLSVSNGASVTIPGGLDVSSAAGTWTVAAGAALTFAPGSRLQNPGASYITLSVSGTLAATSATLTGVYIPVAVGAVVSLQVSTLTTAANGWGIYANGGQVDVQGCALAVNGTNPVLNYHGSSTGTVSGNTFSASGSSSGGTRVLVEQDATPAISANDFVSNASLNEIYVRLDTSATNTTSVTGNTFRASGSDVPIAIMDAGITAPFTISGNLYPTGAGAGNLLGGTLATTALLRRIDGQPTVAALTIASGGVLNVDAASNVPIAGTTILSGGALSASAGATLTGTAGTQLNVSAGGTLTLDRSSVVGLVIYLSGAATITDCDLTALGAVLTINAGGSLTLLRSTLARAGTSPILTFASASSAGELRDNVIQRTTTDTGIRFSAGSANVTLEHNQFVLGGAPWFTQRSARYARLSAGAAHVCGILESGEVRCAGTNTSGQASAPPIVATRVAAGTTHSCALRFDDTPVCWGSAGAHTSLPATAYKRIAAGNGFTCAIRKSDLGLECFGGIAAPPAGTFSELTAGREAGQEFACALGTDARVSCWGSSSYGATAAPTLAYAEVSAGDRHVCARLLDGSVQCWGNNASGQATPASGSFVELASGSLHTCGRRADGSVACWGANGSGQVSAPAQLFSSVTAGGTQSCGTRLDGSPRCWGSAASTSTVLANVADVSVAVGTDHACATNGAAALGCWGQNGSGQAAPPAQPAFLQVGAGTAFGCAAYGSSLFTTSESFGFTCWGANGVGQATANASARLAPALGASHACALTTTGLAVCWGDNTFGQGSPPPATTFVALAAGTRHTCGITTAGTLGCWGSALNGRTTPPGGFFTKLAAGADHSCALRIDGTVLCWGLNDFGQTTVTPGIYTDVAAGDVYSCGLRGDGTAVCWGSSASGRTTPAPGPFAKLDAGGGQACGVRTNGAIACWGAALGGAPAPNDLDADGITDGGDNCPVLSNFTQADAETDGFGDVCDNCPSAYARDQEDRDNDGVGDACDNCPSVANPGQQDADLNGIGDACEDAVVLLRPTPPPPPPGPPGITGLMPPPAPGDQEYDIFVACGTLPIKRVELAVILPQGTLAQNVSFGPGCTATTCAAATGLGATVDKTLSRAQGPGLATAGVRSDAVYFSLVGGSLLAGNLCNAFEERVAGHFVLANTPIAPPVPNLTTEGLAPLGMVPVTDSTNRILLPEEYSFVAQDQTPVLGLSLEPALGDTTGRKWQVELDASVAMNRVTFGLVAPAGTSTAQMRFTGCTTLSGSPATRRTCTATTAFGAYVAPASTFTVGPGAAVSGLRADTLYVSVTGSLAGAGLPALNAAQQPTLLGVVELDSTSIQPALTSDGVTTSSVFGTPFVDTSGAAVATQAVQIAGGYNAPSDYDADARSDDLDNCPFVANTDQMDRGGLATTVPNGRGDRCECGETTDDGAIFSADANVLRDVLAGKAVTSPVIARDRCSVAGTPGCDIADVVVLRRSLSGLAPFPVSACTTAVR